MKLKLIAIQTVIACLIPFQASAQTAVPLEPSLLKWTWAVVDFPGKSDASEVPTFQIGDDHRTVTGKTACNTEWWADVKIDFPKISISSVQGTAYDCPDAKEVTRFLTIIEQADRFHTGAEGLEILKSDGRRLLLMVSGG